MKIEEFKELTVELGKIAAELSFNNFQNTKDEIREILDSMIELYDEIEIDLEEKELDKQHICCPILLEVSKGIDFITAQLGSMFLKAPLNNNKYTINSLCKFSIANEKDREFYLCLSIGKH